METPQGANALKEIEERQPWILPAKVPLMECTHMDLSQHREPMESLPHCVSFLTNLRVLYLSKNLLTHLPFGFSLLTSLKALSLSRNNFDRLPKDVFLLTSLTELQLQKNALTILDDGVSSLVKLSVLDLHGNRLSFLPPAISFLSNLETLNICFNMIEALPAEIARMHKLQDMYIECDGLISVRRAPKDITTLPCWSNSGESEWSECSVSDALHTLQLYDHVSIANFTADITPFIGMWDRLESLDMSFNQVVYLI